MESCYQNLLVVLLGSSTDLLGVNCKAKVSSNNTNSQKKNLTKAGLSKMYGRPVLFDRRSTPCFVALSSATVAIFGRLVQRSLRSLETVSIHVIGLGP